MNTSDENKSASPQKPGLKEAVGGEPILLSAVMNALNSLDIDQNYDGNWRNGYYMARAEAIEAAQRALATTGLKDALTLKEITDFSWATGSIEGVLRGVRCTKELLPNQVEAIDDALKHVEVLKRLAPKIPSL